MLIQTPPMGWNSWNTIGHNINEDVILENAEALVKTGLKDCGYNYVVIDDCWSLRARDKNGYLVADPEKFPRGMKALSDDIHKMGLKFGMYSCCGYKTCAGYPGSYTHEFQDAKTFASWDVDLLKYDYCWKPATVSGADLFRRMGEALATCGRDILFSACTAGKDDTKTWIRSTGAHMWRTTRDINDNWEDMKELVAMAQDSFPYGGANCFPDMDMLIVGMRGEGNVGLGGCTDDEYRLHFSAWAVCGSPLMIGCDLRKADDTTLNILSNPALLAIDQDASGHQPYNLNGDNRDNPIYVRMLENGDYAIGMFNLSEQTAWAAVDNIALDRMGLLSENKTLLLQDVWNGEEIRMEDNVYALDLAPHDFRCFRAKVIDA